jgi:hypothetical protein
VRRRLRTTLVALALIAVGAAGPLAVLASHSFSDVPSGHTFHGDIARVYEARITAGCSPTTYCPDDAVTRGQMAAFLQRTGGRVGVSPVPGAAIPVPGTYTVLNTAQIRAGNVPGGTALVHVNATFTFVTASGTGLPVVGQGVVRFQGGQELNRCFAYGQIDSVNATSTIGYDSAACQDVIEVPTGELLTFEVVARRLSGTAGLLATATVSLAYFPFSEDGDADLN